MNRYAGDHKGSPNPSSSTLAPTDHLALCLVSPLRLMCIGTLAVTLVVLIIGPIVRLSFQQPLLTLNSPTVPTHIPIFPHNSMARDNNGNRICRTGSRNSTS